ncbi:MAG: zinc-binding dehydrogenase [Clostridiales Family XIII bacterium]|jgi:threonine dehydrogenase-like Zn-dependent dehydrogenase|nr:zinc-binding dehydrogenase [Clostridiales Family XIII bacterium]
MSAIPKTSKAAVLVELGKPEVIRDVDIPEIRPGTMLVRVLLAGICGTDVHQAAGELSIPPLVPAIQGHETLGEIVALGSEGLLDIGCRKLKVGDRIMWAHPFCGECYYCRVARKPYMCNAFGTGYGFVSPELLRGGFAEYVHINEKTEVVLVPESVTDEEAIGVGCAFRTVVSGYERLQRHSPIGTADTVVVQGAGPIGLYSTLLAAFSGAARVVTIGAPAERLALAKEWGATVTIDIDEIKDHKDRVKIVTDLTEGRGAEFAIEASGAPNAFLEGFDFLCKDSTYLVMGQTSNRAVEFQPNLLQRKQACVIGSGSADARHYYKALKFIEAHRDRIDFSRMLSSTYELEEINTALENMKLGKDIKGAIDNRKRTCGCSHE